MDATPGKANWSLGRARLGSMGPGTDRGITYTDHSPGNGTGWAKRRILFNKLSN